MPTSILSELLAECKEDYVGLWSILWEVKEESPDRSAARHREMTLEVVRQLLDAGMVAGDFSQDQAFHAWRMSRDELLEKISTAWGKLDKDPTIGDICWFTAPALAASPDK